MNFLIKTIKIKQKEKEYKQYIEEHRQNILKAGTELCDCPALHNIFMDDYFCHKFWQRLYEHDLSKYSNEEFDAYRKYYHPINVQEKINAKEDFQKAWQHHIKVNDHHWQNRQNKTQFDPSNDDDLLPLLENITDWLAMGYKFNDRPYQYYEKHKTEITLCPQEKQLFEKIIYALDNKTIPTHSIAIQSQENFSIQDSVNR